MRMPTPDELRDIERAHFRSVARSKLPTARAAITAGSALRSIADGASEKAKEAFMSTPDGNFVSAHFDRRDNADVSYFLATLRDQWGGEWDELSAAQQVEVLVDFGRMVVQEDHRSALDAAIVYLERIGRGNLGSYADCSLLHKDEGNEATQGTAFVVVNEEHTDAPHRD